MLEDKVMWKRCKVESSMFLAMAYDAERELLELELRDGSIYRYHHVPRVLVRQMYTADSKGKFYHNWVKGLFEGEVVQDIAGRRLFQDSAGTHRRLPVTL